jgi:hypothetical protein
MKHLLLRACVAASSTMVDISNENHEHVDCENLTLQ